MSTGFNYKRNKSSDIQLAENKILFEDITDRYDVVYRSIYDGQISLKQFEKWLTNQLRSAYDKGLRDADSDQSYDDISKSQYD